MTRFHTHHVRFLFYSINQQKTTSLARRLENSQHRCDENSLTGKNKTFENMLIGFLAFCFLRYAVFLSLMTHFRAHIMCVFCFILIRMLLLYCFYDYNNTVLFQLLEKIQNSQGYQLEI